MQNNNWTYSFEDFILNTLISNVKKDTKSRNKGEKKQWPPTSGTENP